MQLEDVATVKLATVPQWQRVTANGRDAVLLQVYQQPTGNTVQIMRDVKSKLAAFQHKIPAGVKISNWYDQSLLITESAASVRDTILIGVALAALIILMILRNLKVTLLAMVTVPTVLAITILLLYMLDMSFNIMTLGGMAAAVGLILDDAIVMIEHIVRCLRGGDSGHPGVVRQAAREFTFPLVGSSSSTVVIFLPLAFLGGVTGAFFKPLSLTMGCALVISFFVAWFGIPILAAHIISQKDTEIEDVGPLTRLFQRGYRAVLAVVLRRPWLLVIGLIPLIAGGYLGYHEVGSGFMPAMDEGSFVIDYLAVPGTSLKETDRLCRQIEAILSANPEVASYSRRTGTQLGGGLTEANQGDLFVRLKPPPRRTVYEIMDAVRRQIEQRVPGLKIEMAQLMEDLIGDLTAVPQPIEIKLYGDDPKMLMNTAPKIAQAIANVPGVVEIKNGIKLAGDALEIQIDRDRAALEGIDPEAITRQLRSYFTGDVATQVQQGEKFIGIRVWIPKDVRATTDNIPELWFQSPHGHWFPLKRVAKVRMVTGQPEITRDNLKRMIAVTARISGRDMGSTVRDVQRILSKAGSGSSRHVLRAWRAVQAAEDRLQRFDCSVRRSGGFGLFVVAFSLRTVSCSSGDSGNAAVGYFGSIIRALGHRYGTQHHIHDGHDHGGRHCNRGGYFLLFGVPGFTNDRSSSRPGSGGSRPKSHATYCHDNPRSNHGSSSFGSGIRSRCCNAATSCHCNYFRLGNTDAVGSDCHACILPPDFGSSRDQFRKAGRRTAIAHCFNVKKILSGN